MDADISQLIARVADLERRVAALDGEQGIAPGPPGQNPEIARLAREGNLIQAIKLYREQTGVGLREAKDAVEALARGY
jgi:large subunit ribosomal protein L7/L12